MNRAGRGPSPLLLPLSECCLARFERTGGKAARLGALQGAGFPVAPGFVLTTDAYRSFFRGRRAMRVKQALSGPEAGDALEAARLVSSHIRALFEAAAMPASCYDAIAEGYENLARATGIPDPPVAVRSSATAECLGTHSFAGQQESFLWIRGVAEVAAHVRKVWSSLFTPQAILYRKSAGFPTGKALMAVIVQVMVDARAAGVLFTMNPANGDRSKILIEGNWGFGESVVSGEISPDRFMVDKATLEIIGRHIAPKSWEYVVAPSGCGTVRGSVAEGHRNQSCLADVEIASLANIAKRVERRFGEPQDMEWAVARAGTSPAGIVLVQSRPETAWKMRPARPAIPSAPNAAGYILRSLRGRAGEAGGPPFLDRSDP